MKTKQSFKIKIDDIEKKKLATLLIRKRIRHPSPSFYIYLFCAQVVFHFRYGP